MILEKIARFCEGLVVDKYSDEPRGSAIVAAIVAGAIGGYQVTDDWAVEEWDTRAQEPSSAYVEIFNKEAQDIRHLREDLVMMDKRAEIAAYDAKRAGQEWEITDAEIVQKFKIEKQIEADTEVLWSATLTNTDLKEQDLSFLMQNNADIFNRRSMPASDRTYAFEECQIETAAEPHNEARTELEQAKAIASCARNKTSDDGTSFLGGIPGAVVGLFSLAAFATGAGGAANSLQRRRENKKNKQKLGRN